MKKSLFFVLLCCQQALWGQTGAPLTSADGTTLYYKESGSGQPVVLLAGGPGLNATYLDSVARQLSARYRCIVPDQRGTGKSRLAMLDSQTLSLTQYLNDIEALRQHLQLETLTLVGHSWGSMLAMHYAAYYPTRVNKLLLLNPGGPTSRFQSYFADNIQMRLLPEDSSFSWAAYFFRRDHAYANKAAFAPEVLNGQNVNKVFTTLMQLYAAGDAERVRLLPLFKGPVCLLHGRQDPIGESTAYEIKSLLPQTNLIFIEKCGHFPWLETSVQSRQFFDLIDAFLKE